MDPFTAALIIGGVSAGFSMLQSSKMKKEQEKAMRQQRGAQAAQQQKEMGAASQTLSMSLGQARQRPTGMQGGGMGATSFSSMGTSALGNLQPQSAGSSTSGTF